MDKKIKLILAGMILSSVLVFIVFLYIASAVMHKIPTHIALILGAAVTITDTVAALFILTRSAKPKQ